MIVMPFGRTGATGGSNSHTDRRHERAQQVSSHLRQYMEDCTVGQQGVGGDTESKHLRHEVHAFCCSSCSQPYSNLPTLFQSAEQTRGGRQSSEEER